MRTLGSKIDVEDTVVATFGFKNGAVGTLEITTAARPIDYEASISILGSKGMVQIGGIAVNKLETFTPKPSIISKFSESFKRDYYGFGHKYLYKSEFSKASARLLDGFSFRSKTRSGIVAGQAYVT